MARFAECRVALAGARQTQGPKSHLAGTDVKGVELSVARRICRGASDSGSRLLRDSSGYVWSTACGHRLLQTASGLMTHGRSMAASLRFQPFDFSRRDGQLSALEPPLLNRVRTLACQPQRSFAKQCSMCVDVHYAEHDPAGTTGQTPPVEHASPDAYPKLKPVSHSALSKGTPDLHPGLSIVSSRPYRPIWCAKLSVFLTLRWG